MTINTLSSNLSQLSLATNTNSESTLNNNNSEQQQAANITNIWSQILQDVQQHTKKSPPPKSIILLGDNESGRSTLVSRLKGVETISKGIGLEYHYVDIKDEDRDDIQKLGVWIPDGDGANINLLKFALNETNIDNVLICFVVSMSTPWSIMESLNKWSNILREHLKKLSLSEKKRADLLKQQIRLFQSYQEPDEKNSNNHVSTTKLKLISNDSDSKQTLESSTTLEKEKNDDDDVLLTLDPNILRKNLGLPIVVIATKSDCISILDKEMEYRIEHFDFIQYHIRKFCLEYGAALFYTTVKDRRTHEKLYKYLIHKLYNYSFNHPAAVVDRESIFIPSGWDNEAKINILLENSTTIKSDSEYPDVIVRPSIARKPLQRDVDATILSQDDQEFLAKLQLLLNKSSTPSVNSKADEMTSSSSSSMMNSANMSASSMSSSSSTQQMNLGGSTTPPSIKSPHKPTVKANQPDSNNLKNFFQNLLNKNAPSSSAGSSSNTTTSNNSADNQTPTNLKSESNA